MELERVEHKTQRVEIKVPAVIVYRGVRCIPTAQFRAPIYGELYLSRHHTLHKAGLDGCPDPRLIYVDERVATGRKEAKGGKK